MPAQLSAILYISNYQEKTSGEFFIGTAIGHARLDENADTVQRFNITVFYPLDDEVVCHVPKLEVDQVLSVANSKFCRGPENQIDITLTAATVLNIKPEDLPVHPIHVVGTAFVTEGPTITENGTQFTCRINEYFGRDKPVELSVIFFHPQGSRLASQTSTVKRGSLVFFSGSLTSIEGNFYLELHNFTFVRAQPSIQAKGNHEMPWSNNNNLNALSTSTSTSTPSPSPSPSSSSKSIAQSIHKQVQEQQQQTSKSGKRKYNTKFQPKKNLKLADLATAALSPATQQDSPTEVQEGTNNQQNE